MYKKTKESQIPKRERKTLSRFEVTPEWRMMKSDIDKGLKPQEALQVVLTESEMAKYRITNRRTIARFVQNYLTERGLKYGVKSFQREVNEYIVVSYTPVIRGVA